MQDQNRPLLHCRGLSWAKHQLLYASTLGRVCAHTFAEIRERLRGVTSGRITAVTRLDVLAILANLASHLDELVKEGWLVRSAA
jgi:hypothetical protein